MLSHKISTIGLKPMSYFSFLSTPDKIGITSCVDGELEEIPILTHQNILTYGKALSECNASIINQQANKGKLFLLGKVNTLDGYQKEYKINDCWMFEAQRASKDTWYFMLKPIDINAVYNYKMGLKKIARKHLTNSVDVDVWIRYDKVSKIFYLKEFGAVVNDSNLIKAIMNYTEHFSTTDYQRWIEHYEWSFPTMSYIHRLYLKRHIQQYVKHVKKLNK